MKIYRAIKKKGESKTYIGAVKIKHCFYNGNNYTKKYLGGLLSYSRQNNVITFCICNIKLFSIKDRNAILYSEIKNISNKMSSLERDLKHMKLKHNMNFAIANRHSSLFPRYKDIHKGKSAVLLATGPTLLDYIHIDNVINIGVNSVFKQEGIKLDYWFSIDASVNIENIELLKNENFIKFFGQGSAPLADHLYNSRVQNKIWHFPDSIIECVPNSHLYYFDHPSNEINRDIETQALPDLGSSVFSAAYFALYAGIKKLYLVGCDCSDTGHFDNHAQFNFNKNLLLKGWDIFKYYTETFYPDVEIISINPVGLKGFFIDIYTNSNGEYVDIDGNVVNLNED